MLVPTDEDGNGRLDTLHVLYSIQDSTPRPGDDIALRFEVADLAGMDEATRTLFEVRGGR